ncbi:Kelch repeat-containing protein [Stigmatella hybrida]|uniref:Kelch repeat-containing protein n=1 Tax=Stigmatella hybrida TaxID=394097 RepID=UPI001CDA74CC|nr:kelch repeat-containing protein [Stigmatella hybrida]
MSLLRLFAFPLLMLAVLAGCEPSPLPPSGAPTGAMRLAIETASAAPGDVSRVTVTVSASDMASLSTQLVLTDGTWSGVLEGIPAGPHRSFLAQAFTAAGTLRYEGRAEDVTVTADATGLVALTLQDVTPPPPLSNEAPLIDSLRVNPSTVVPGGSVSLAVSAHDPNAGDTLSFAWEAPSGSFSAPAQPQTLWTAPATQGAVTLVLTVSDSRGASLSVSVTVNVSQGSGASEVKVGFNTAPKLVALTSTQSYLNVGQPTALSVSATDVDGDSLSYQWNTTCAGSFTDMAATSAAFTPSALPTSPCNNCQVSVTVKDGRGGQNTGHLALCVSKGVVWRATGSWTAVEAMAARRYEHTATLLPGGQVLVLGGWSDTGFLAAAEVFNPATGTWSPTAPMSKAHFWHAATLLPNGKVLVSGGSNGNGFLAASEVYDPATGTWSLSGSLSTPRYRQTATLLLDGRVLIVGGIYNSSPLASSEVYDPATGAWSPTGALPTPLYRHTATLLPNGKVLLAGGEFPAGYLAAAHVYDPGTGTWSPTGVMLSKRAGHTATLLANGKVLVSGGENSQGGRYMSASELYDPATGTWSPTGSLSTPRSWHTATLLANGKVLVTGGYNDVGSRYLAASELYDPVTGTWSPTGSLTTPRYVHTATRLDDGRVLITGGYNTSAYLASAEVYDPPTAF